jgi:hypothetical protein
MNLHEPTESVVLLARCRDRGKAGLFVVRHFGGKLIREILEGLEKGLRPTQGATAQMVPMLGLTVAEGVRNILPETQRVLGDS